MCAVETGAGPYTQRDAGERTRHVLKHHTQPLLAKPVHRWEFILGKYLGLLLTLLINVSVMTLGLWLALAYHGNRNDAGDENRSSGFACRDFLEPRRLLLQREDQLLDKGRH